MSLLENINDLEKAKFGYSETDLTYVRVSDIEAQSIVKAVQDMNKSLVFISRQIETLNQYMVELFDDEI